MSVHGEMPEWLIGAVCKTAVLTGFAGSNPALSTIIQVKLIRLKIADIAQMDIVVQNLYNAIVLLPT
jgi:hypothetical protein